MSDMRPPVVRSGVGRTDRPASRQSTSLIPRMLASVDFTHRNLRPVSIFVALKMIWLWT